MNHNAIFCSIASIKIKILVSHHFFPMTSSSIQKNKISGMVLLHITILFEQKRVAEGSLASPQTGYLLFGSYFTLGHPICFSTLQPER